VLDPLVQMCRGKAALRTLQYEGKRPISFGRLAWNAQSHSRWTHGSPITHEKARAWRFAAVELWAPTWSACERDGLAPEVFFAAFNEKFASDGTNIRFSQRLFLAVAADLGQIAERQARSAVQRLAQSFNGVLTAYQQRPWGFAFGSAFSESIQDMLILGLFTPGNPHERPIDPTSFRERWSEIDTKAG
jgi:hypothetical protein